MAELLLAAEGVFANLLTEEGRPALAEIRGFRSSGPAEHTVVEFKDQRKDILIEVPVWAFLRLCDCVAGARARINFYPDGREAIVRDFELGQGPFVGWR